MQVIVKLTTGCNLKCVYCSEGNIDKEDLSIEILYKLIDELPILLNKYKDNNIDLLWHGGEPLIVGKNKAPKPFGAVFFLFRILVKRLFSGCRNWMRFCRESKSIPIKRGSEPG